MIVHQCDYCGAQCDAGLPQVTVELPTLERRLVAVWIATDKDPLDVCPACIIEIARRYADAMVIQHYSTTRTQETT